MPRGKNFVPKVSLLVEAFIGMTDTLITLDSAVSCWTSPPVHVPQQRDEGTLAHVISYLDEIATHQPSHKAWDELVWPLPSFVPHTPSQNEPLGFIQGCIVEFGSTMPPVQFHVSGLSGKFLGYAQGLIYKGTVLIYDPTANGTEWIPICGTASDLTWVKRYLLWPSVIWSHTAPAHSVRG